MVNQRIDKPYRLQLPLVATKLAEQPSQLNQKDLTNITVAKTPRMAVLLKIVNKCGGKYSSNSYNIEAATKDKIVYPSLDPSVFEIKFPDSDIKGRVR